MAGMNSKSFKTPLTARAKAAKGMRTAFRGDDDEPTPPAVGHTRLDDEPEPTGFAARMGKSVKKRLGR